MTNSVSDLLGHLTAMEQAGASIVQLMEAAKLDPKHGFCGGDWRYVAFDGLKLDGFDLRETRLFGATFQNASVAGAKLRGAEGATPLRGAPGLYAARNWDDADLDDHQRLLLLCRDHLERPGRRQLPIAEFIKAGLITEANFVVFMRKSGDFEVARAIYDQMLNNGLPPNKYALTTLIGLAKRSDWLIDELYKEAVSNHVQIDHVFLNNVADAYSTYILSRSVADLYGRHGLLPDEFAFNIWIKKAESKEAVSALLNEMRDAGISPSEITLNSVMMHYTDWNDRVEHLNKLLEDGLKPRLYDLNAVLTSAITKKEIKDTLEMFRRYSISQDLASYNIRMFKRKNIYEAMPVLEEALASGKKPDSFTQKTLTLKTQDFTELCYLIATLRTAGLDMFNDHVIRRLIRLSPDPTWSATRVQGLEMSGASLADRVKALIVHWIPERERSEVLTKVFEKTSSKYPAPPYIFREAIPASLKRSR